MTALPHNINSYPLITTKYNRPRRTGDLVPRPHLIEKLNTGLNRKLTLISAPAGYGKTTLLLSWLENCERSSVWLSLDENDSDLPRFVSYFIAAVRTHFPRAGSATLALLNDWQNPPPDYVVASFVNDIAELDELFVVAFDDFHLINDVDTQHFMQQLIKAQPEPLHLAIASRSDPPWMLGGLRANHHLTEIRGRDLRFSDQEAALFFQGSVGDEVEETISSGLNRLTEGWTVGLRLAALSLQSGRDGTAILDGYAAGSSDFVTDYLMGEVLNQQSNAMQEFLLCTSILDRFCVELCDAVCRDVAETEMPDSFEKLTEQSATDHLARIRQTNLFLVPLDTEDGWYRYHHLFSELLRHRLFYQCDREQVESLHRRASVWFANAGYLEEAVQHALSANDMEFAVELIESQSRNLLNPIERAVLERWVSLLPEDVIWRRPKILVARAWILFRQWNMAALDATLDRIQLLLDGEGYTPDDRTGIGGQVAALRCATAYALHGDWQTVIELSGQAFDQVALSEGDARGLALMMRTQSQQAVGQREIAVRQLTQNIEEPSPVGTGKTQSYISLSLLHYMTGDLAEMERTISRMLSFSARSASVNATAATNYVSGFFYYERNDLQTAEVHFERVLGSRHRTNVVGGLAAGQGQIRVHQLHGQPERAQELIDILRAEILAIENYYLLPLLDAAQAEHHLLNGVESSALSWARTSRSGALRDGVFVFELPILTQTRILARCGTDEECRAQLVWLQEQLVVVEAGFFINRTIQLLAHLALLRERLGQPDETFALLKRAVEMGQSTGFVRSIVDAGIYLAPYHQQLSECGVRRDYLVTLQSAADDDIRGIPLVDQRNAVERSLDKGLDEPLTRRESEILQLIGRGLTNQEIADELVISPHTVKTHATNIYVKLGVSGRTHAVHKARKMGILLNNS